MDKVKVFEPHTDYIRCMAIHPTLPYVFSSSSSLVVEIGIFASRWLVTLENKTYMGLPFCFLNIMNLWYCGWCVTSSPYLFDVCIGTYKIGEIYFGDYNA